MQGRKPEDGAFKSKVPEETRASRTGNWDGTFSNAQETRKGNSQNRQIGLSASCFGLPPKKIDATKHACDSLRVPVCRIASSPKRQTYTPLPYLGSMALRLHSV